jgi:AcrR family transcriptional regulator
VTKSLSDPAPARRRPKANVGSIGIILAAERLFGEQGIEAVSLRQVSAAAGLANNYSVQYHFTDRYGLLRAMYELRLPAIDARRAVLFNELKTGGGNTTPVALLDCQWRPFLELAVESNNRSFAGVMAQVLRNPDYREMQILYEGLTPNSWLVLDQLRQVLGIEREDVFSYRCIAASTIILDAIHDPSLYGSLRSDGEDPQTAYELALRCAAGCLDYGRPAE